MTWLTWLDHGNLYVIIYTMGSTMQRESGDNKSLQSIFYIDIEYYYISIPSLCFLSLEKLKAVKEGPFKLLG